MDDERVVSDTLCRIFAHAGYEVRALSSAEQALELVRMNRWIPQFTLLDVHMPGMNGVELAILLKAECPDCQITLLSGYAGTADLLDAAAHAGHVFRAMPKPVHPSELLSLAAERLAIPNERH